jgi:hypothetical protein
MTAVGAIGQFFYQAFALTRQAFPTSLSFLLIQDMPDRLLAWPAAPSLIVLFGLLLFRGGRVMEIVRLALLTSALGYFVIRVLRGPGNGPPTSREEFLVVVALGLLLLLNAMALVLSFAVHFPQWTRYRFIQSLQRELVPPELAFYALVLQYVTQFNYSGLRYSYMGTYLSLPVALLTVRAVLRARGIPDSKPATSAVPAAVSLLLAAWFITGSIVVTRGTVYRDADRAHVTGRFSSGKLAGVTSRPANVAVINGLVAAIGQYSHRGDPILVFPDFPVMYFITDRVNPTRIDWYDPGEIIPTMTEQAVTDLRRWPPRVVLLQSVDEADFQRLGTGLDYIDQPKWRPLYLYIRERYQQVTMIGDIAVLVPRDNS